MASVRFQIASYVASALQALNLPGFAVLLHKHEEPVEGDNSQPSLVVVSKKERYKGGVFGKGVLLTYPILVILVLQRGYYGPDFQIEADTREAVRLALFQPALMGQGGLVYDCRYNPDPAFNEKAWQPFDVSAQEFEYDNKSLGTW